MIYAGDTYTPLPTKELYNTQMMMASIAAAKDMYDKTEKQLDEFFKTYNDFRSPVSGAQEEYARLTTNRVNDALNQLYKQGIDPLRNAQGRAAIQQIIRSTDYGRINKLKHQAENYNKYLDTKREMVAQGLTTDDFENWVLKQQGLDGFTAVYQDGQKKGQIRDWTRLTPEQYISVDAATDPWFKDIEETYLGMTQDGFDRFGIDENKLNEAIQHNIYDLINTKSGQYNLEKFGRATGVISDDASQEDIINAINSESLINSFKQDILNRRKKMIHEKRQFNDRVKMSLDQAFQASEAAKERQFRASQNALDRSLSAASNALYYDKKTGQYKSIVDEPTPEELAYSSAISQMNLSITAALGLNDVKESKYAIESGIVSNPKTFNNYLSNNFNKNISKGIIAAISGVSSPIENGTFEKLNDKNMTDNRVYLPSTKDIYESKEYTNVSPRFKKNKSFVSLEEGDLITPLDRTVAIADEKTGVIKTFDVVVTYSSKEDDKGNVLRGKRKGVSLLPTGSQSFPITTRVFGYDPQKSNAAYAKSKRIDKEISTTTAKSSTITTHN